MLSTESQYGSPCNMSVKCDITMSHPVVIRDGVIVSLLPLSAEVTCGPHPDNKIIAL